MISAFNLNSKNIFIWKGLGSAAVFILCFMVLLEHMGELTPNTLHRVKTSQESFNATIEQQPETTFSSSFAINTPTCKIPEVDPLHPSIVHYKVYPMNELNCSKNMRPLSYSENFHLVIDPTAFPAYGVSSFQDLICYYAGIDRVEQNYTVYDLNSDNLYRIKEKIWVKDLRTPIEEDGILVNCTPVSATPNTKPYLNVHYYIQRRHVEERIQNFAKKGGWNNNHEIMNVLLFGIDSVSRTNLKRHMPKLYDYVLNELGGLDFRGFNKVGSHTNNNVIPLFAALSYREFYVDNVCKPPGRSYADQCSFIWKDFSKHGYATAYAEDPQGTGILHAGYPGYVSKPADYYIRNFILVSEDYTAHHGDYPTIKDLCLGTKESVAVLCDYVYDVSQALKDVPTFNLAWCGHSAHETLRGAAIAEGPLLRLLEKLKESGSLENTAVLLLSDHGMMLTDFRATYLGTMESRLPFFLLVLPQWFKKKYPQTWQNLKTNTHRLVTHFDIHETMRSVLHQDYNPTIPPKISPVRNFSQSLFVEVPLNRTCAEAGIEMHFCSCHNKQEVPSNLPGIVNATNLMVRHINELLSEYSSLCAFLILKEVLSAKKIINNYDNFNIYTIQFTTKPGEAKFEGTVSYSIEKQNILGDISRVNMYRNQSNCIIHDVDARPYCYCRDLL